MSFTETQKHAVSKELLQMCAPAVENRVKTGLNIYINIYVKCIFFLTNRTSRSSPLHLILEGTAEGIWWRQNASLGT